jgi:hypothetical protein
MPGPLAILIAANPRNVKESGEVYLPKGRWEFQTNAKDTKLFLHYKTPTDGWMTPIEIPCGQIIFGPTKVKVEIEKPGTEQYINVFAKCLD